MTLQTVKHPALGFEIAWVWPPTCFVPIWAALSRIGVYLTCKASKKGWMHFGTKLWMHFRCSKAKSLTVKVWPGDGCRHSWPQSYLNVRGIVFRKPAATLYKTCNTFEYFLLVVYYTQNSHIFLKQADLFYHFPSTHLFLWLSLSLWSRGALSARRNQNFVTIMGKIKVGKGLSIFHTFSFIGRVIAFQIWGQAILDKIAAAGDWLHFDMQQNFPSYKRTNFLICKSS